MAEETVKGEEYNWNKPEALAALDRTPIGEELATAFAKKLFASTDDKTVECHRDYCGYGLFKREGVVLYGSSQDGYWPLTEEEDTVTFATEADLVAVARRPERLHAFRRRGGAGAGLPREQPAAVGCKAEELLGVIRRTTHRRSISTRRRSISLAN